MKIPLDVELEVVGLMFKQADEVGWTLLPNPQSKAKFYEAWTTDSNIGGRLGQFMSPEQVRTWIKNSAMKEFNRARAGKGKYAHLVANPAADVRTLVAKAMGPGWTVDEATRPTGKPLRVRVRRQRGDHEETFAWAEGTGNFKNLLWAALVARADGDPTAWTLCVVESVERRTPSDVRKRNEDIAKDCDVTVAHVVA